MQGGGVGVEHGLDAEGDARLAAAVAKRKSTQHRNAERAEPVPQDVLNRSRIPAFGPQPQRHGGDLVEPTAAQQLGEESVDPVWLLPHVFQQDDRATRGARGARPHCRGEKAEVASCCDATGRTGMEHRRLLGRHVHPSPLTEERGFVRREIPRLRLRNSSGRHHWPEDRRDGQARADRFVQGGHITGTNEQLGRHPCEPIPVHQVDYPHGAIAAACTDHRRGVGVPPRADEVTRAGLVGTGEVAPTPVEDVFTERNRQPKALQYLSAEAKPVLVHRPTRSDHRDRVTWSQRGRPPQRAYLHAAPSPSAIAFLTSRGRPRPMGSRRPAWAAWSYGVGSALLITRLAPEPSAKLHRPAAGWTDRDVPTASSTSQACAAEIAASSTAGSSAWPNEIVADLRIPPHFRHGGSSSPAATRSKASVIGVRSPQLRQPTWRIVPWISMTRSGLEPAA